MSVLDQFTVYYQRGQMRYVPESSTLDTYIPCDGRTLTISDNSELYADIGSIPDGITDIKWVSTSSSPAALTYGNGIYVFGSTNGTVQTSTDAITWTIRTSGTSSSIRSIIYENGLYVYAGNGGVLATSTNAITWTARTSGTTSSIQSLTYGNGLYVYGGVGGVLRTSTDAITWDSRTSGTTNDIHTVIYANGLYVYGGGGGVLATSTDAITWTARTPGIINGTAGIYTINYGNGIFIYGGQSSIVGTSTDAITWTSRILPYYVSNTSLTCILIIDNIFLAILPDFVFYSYDGNNWINSNATMPIQPPTSVPAATSRNGKCVFGVTSGIMHFDCFLYDNATEFVMPLTTNNLLIDQLSPTNYITNMKGVK